MSSRRKRAYLFLILAALIWGAAGPIIKYTLEAIDPLPFLAYRFAISAFFASGYFINKLTRRKKFRQLKANLPLALLYSFLAVPLGLGILFTGLDKSTVLDLTLMGVMGPMLVTAGAAFFFRDRITKRERFGIAIVLAGVAINSFLPIFRSESAIVFTGNFLIFLSLLIDSSATLLSKYLLRKRIKSGNLTNLAFIVGAVTMVPYVIFLYGAENLVSTIINLPLQYHLGVWYMAILSGNIGYYLYVRALRTIEVSEAVLFNYLQPLFTIPLAIFWLGENLSTSFIIGALIIAGGIFIAGYKKSHDTARGKPQKTFGN